MAPPPYPWLALSRAAGGGRSLSERLPRLVVERISALEPDLFACDGFHPNRRAHAIWGEEIAALALPFVGHEKAAKLWELHLPG